jgi:teichuronic acid biosynthesis glycosyltransferase TuaC
MPMSRDVRTVLFSTLYPSSARPLHGIFVETRLRELLSRESVQTKVVAPVPWFPSTADRWGEFAKMATTPRRELRNGVEVLHPRYLVIPKLGMNVAPLLLAAGALSSMKKLIADGFDFDVLDAHYYYPDGVAAAILARHLGKPVTITARGTDLNLIPQHYLPRKMMQWAARRADASIGVCSALVDVLRNWSIDESRLHVMRNGVDLERFTPMPKALSREALGLAGSPIFLSVGHLIERKGHHIAIEALAEVRHQHPDARLVIVGEGTERVRLAKRAAELGLQDVVTLVGAIPNTDLARWYSAADVLILASSREGWANVLLEAMACGTPVVATKIWGTPEVVPHAALGRLVDERHGVAFASAISSLLEVAPSSAAIRAHAELFGWADTSRSQAALFAALATLDA